MRISYWSSDVCSSDLAAPALRRPLHHRVRRSSPSIARVRTANREAIQEPQARAFVNAVQIYPFSDGALYRLYAAPERVTDIALQAGEGVISVAAGDTARWSVGDTTSGSGEAKRVHILVKQIGRASCRGRGGRYGLISGVGGSIKT